MVDWVVVLAHESPQIKYKARRRMCSSIENDPTAATSRDRHTHTIDDCIFIHYRPVRWDWYESEIYYVDYCYELRMPINNAKATTMAIMKIIMIP
jgi:hypothetical protein